MNSIYSYSLDDLSKIMQSMGESNYRAKQIFSWLYKADNHANDHLTYYIYFDVLSIFFLYFYSIQYKLFH